MVSFYSHHVAFPAKRNFPLHWQHNSFMLVVSAQAPERQKMKYLVTASEGPGWSTPEEALKVLEKGVLPTFDILLKLQAEKRIVAGGLPANASLYSFWWRLPTRRLTKSCEIFPCGECSSGRLSPLRALMAGRRRSEAFFPN